MSDVTPLVSVLIISKEDRGLLDTLQSVAQLGTKMQYEVVVVDASQGSLDDIWHDFPWVRWIPFTPLPRKQISIPEQRNAAVKASRGEIVVFIDASCIPGDAWLDTLVGPIVHTGESVVTGRTVSRGGSTIHDIGGRKLDEAKYVLECGTGNLAFRREVFLDVGGFDCRFDYGSDVDFAWRVVDAGYKIRYVPEARVAHDWGNATTNVRRAFLYGAARVRLYRKHPRRLVHYGLRDTYVLAYMIYIIGLPLTIVFWPYPFLILPVLIRNWSRRPFGVLSMHLIYAAGALYELVRL
jgi:cellulose synthase/poly-beta-1,6-N-acetylglucosamine synthase-like glycosyltransferase